MTRRARLTPPRDIAPKPWGDTRWSSPATVAAPRPPVSALDAFGCVLLAALADGLRAVMWEGPNTWIVTLPDGTRVAVAARVIEEFE